MSQQQQQAPKHKLSLGDLSTTLRFFLQFIRARNDPKAFEQVVEELTQESGVPPKDIPIERNAFLAVKDVAQDKRAYSVVDRYLVGGMGVVDLILLQVLLSAGTLDTPQFVALFLLVLSLPLTAMSLFFSFVKQQYQIPTYGRIHSHPFIPFAIDRYDIPHRGALARLSRGWNCISLLSSGDVSLGWILTLPYPCHAALQLSTKTTGSRREGAKMIQGHTTTSRNMSSAPA